MGLLTLTLLASLVLVHGGQRVARGGHYGLVVAWARGLQVAVGLLSLSP